MILSTTVERIIVEESLGMKPKRPDTPEEAKFRALTKKDIEECKRKGYAIDVPSEWPLGTRNDDDE